MNETITTGDAVAARSVTGSAGCCCTPAWAIAAALPDPADPAAGPCCGTTADARTAGACCGATARAEAVASGAGCCG